MADKTIVTQGATNFWDLWLEIAAKCRRIGEPDDEPNLRYAPGLFLTRRNKWLIGPYCGLNHIVEQSILRDLKLNTGILDDEVAPCVLAYAELHKCLFTPALARADATAPGAGSLRTQARQQFGQRTSRDILEDVYDGFYSRPEMRELDAIARIIIGRVRPA